MTEILAGVTAMEGLNDSQAGSPETRKRIGEAGVLDVMIIDWGAAESPPA